MEMSQVSLDYCLYFPGGVYVKSVCANASLTGADWREEATAEERSRSWKYTKYLIVFYNSQEDESCSSASQKKRLNRLNTQGLCNLNQLLFLLLLQTLTLARRALKASLSLFILKIQ